MPIEKHIFGPGGSHCDLTKLGEAAVGTLAAPVVFSNTPSIGGLNAVALPTVANSATSYFIPPVLPESYLVTVLGKSDASRAMVIAPEILGGEERPFAQKPAANESFPTVTAFSAVSKRKKDKSRDRSRPYSTTSSTNGGAYEGLRSPPDSTMSSLSNSANTTPNTLRPRAQPHGGTSSASQSPALSPTSRPPIAHMRNRASNIRIATYNIFYDLYDDPAVNNFAKERLPLIVDEIEKLDADVIALQEVTPWFYEGIRNASPMLREQYFWTKLPTHSGAGANSEVYLPYGQVILSRFPILDAAFLNLNAKKKCLFALIFMHTSKAATTAPEDCVFLVGNVHLKSDYNGIVGENQDVRSLQLKKMFNAVRCPAPGAPAATTLFSSAATKQQLLTGMGSVFPLLRRQEQKGDSNGADNDENAGEKTDADGSNATLSYVRVTPSYSKSQEYWSDPTNPYSTVYYHGLDLAVERFKMLYQHVLTISGTAGNANNYYSNAFGTNFTPSSLALANLPCVLLGDFNMNEQETLAHMAAAPSGQWDADFRDIHLATRSREDEKAGKVLYTYDSTKNNLLINTSFPPMRFDRVLIRDFAAVSSGSLRLFGTKPTRTFVPMSRNPQINAEAVIAAEEQSPADAADEGGESLSPLCPKQTVAALRRRHSPASPIVPGAIDDALAGIPHTLSTIGLDAAEIAWDHKLKTMSRKETNVYDLDAAAYGEVAEEESEDSPTNDANSPKNARRRKSGGGGGGEDPASPLAPVGDGPATAPNSSSAIAVEGGGVVRKPSAPAAVSDSKVVAVEEEYAGRWLVDLYPSDHFGVVCNIERSLKTPPSRALPTPANFTQFTSNKCLTGSFCSIASDAGCGYDSLGNSPAMTPTSRAVSPYGGVVASGGGGDGGNGEVACSTTLMAISSANSSANNTPATAFSHERSVSFGDSIGPSGVKGGKKGGKEKEKKKSKKQLQQEEMEAALNHPSRRHDGDTLSPSMGPSREPSMSNNIGVPPMQLMSLDGDGGREEMRSPEKTNSTTTTDGSVAASGGGMGPPTCTVPPSLSDPNGRFQSSSGATSAAVSPAIQPMQEETMAEDKEKKDDNVKQNAVSFASGPSSIGGDRLPLNAHTLPPSPAAHAEKSRRGVEGSLLNPPSTAGKHEGANARSPSAPRSYEQQGAITSNIGIQMFSPAGGADSASHKQVGDGRGGGDGPTMPPSAAMSLGSQPVLAANAPTSSLLNPLSADAGNSSGSTSDTRKVVGKAFVPASAAAVLVVSHSTPTSPLEDKKQQVAISSSDDATTTTSNDGLTATKHHRHTAVANLQSIGNDTTTTTTNSGSPLVPVQKAAPTSADATDVAARRQQLSSSSVYRASALGLQQQQKRGGDEKVKGTASSPSSSSASESSDEDAERELDEDEKRARIEAKKKTAKHHIRQPDGGASRQRQRRHGGTGNAVASLHVDPKMGAAPQTSPALISLVNQNTNNDGDSDNSSTNKLPSIQVTTASQAGAGANLFKSFATALCIIPPPKLCSQIDILRTEYDKAYTRWMPHITILYPFVHPAKFADAIPLLQHAVSRLPPFRVILRKMAILNEDDPAAKKHVLYIVPEVKTEDLNLLQATVQRIFPQCVRPAMHGQALTAEGFPQFRPHLTVGQIPANATRERNEIFDWFKRHWQNQEFTVSQLHVVMENTVTAGNTSFDVAGHPSGSAGARYESESRGSGSSSSSSRSSDNSSSSESDSDDDDNNRRANRGGKQNYYAANRKKKGGKRSVNSTPTPEHGPGGLSRRNNKKGQRRNQNTVSDDDLPTTTKHTHKHNGDGSDDDTHHGHKTPSSALKVPKSKSNATSPTTSTKDTPAGTFPNSPSGSPQQQQQPTRRELKAIRNAKKHEERQAVQAGKRSMQPAVKRTGIYEVVHSVSLQGEAEFVNGNAASMTPAMTPKATPQPPPRMEELMPMPDLVLPPSSYSGGGKSGGHGSSTTSAAALKSSSAALLGDTTLVGLMESGEVASRNVNIMPPAANGSDPDVNNTTFAGVAMGGVFSDSNIGGQQFLGLDAENNNDAGDGMVGGKDEPTSTSTNDKPRSPPKEGQGGSGSTAEPLSPLTRNETMAVGGGGGGGGSLVVSPSTNTTLSPVTAAGLASPLPQQHTMSAASAPAPAGSTGIAAVLSPSALVAAVANSSILPTASGLAEDSLLPLMVMEETRTAEAYEPVDPLERWLAKNSDRSLARLFPTHTSQQGGMYHIAPQLLHGFMREWRTALLGSDPALNAKHGGGGGNHTTTTSASSDAPSSTFTPVPFFIEEVRTSQYRLYVDIDMIVCSPAATDANADPAITPPPSDNGGFQSIATTYLSVASAAAGVTMTTSSSANNTVALNLGGAIGAESASPSSSPSPSPSSSSVTYKNLIRQICIETQQMFGVGEADSAALVLYSHGPWPATPREPTIVAKTGYRMYFQRIFVDQATHRRYLTRLANEIRRSLGAVPPMCPVGTTWSDIISDQCAQWSKARLLGTVKLRRNLQRQYKCIGIFDAGHAETNGWDVQLSQQYTSDARRMMFGQMVRVWNASMWLPKDAPAAAAESGAKSNASFASETIKDGGDDLPLPPAFSLGSPLGTGSNSFNIASAALPPPPLTNHHRPGFYGVRKNNRRRGVLKALDSDEDDYHFAQHEADTRRRQQQLRPQPPAVTPLLRPLKPRDPTKEIVLDNAFRLDRYFTALEGIERAAQ